MRAREAAAELLYEIKRDKSYASLVLKNKLSAMLSDSREKALATELVYGSIRYKKHLDYIRDLFCKIKLSKLHPYTVAVLRLSLYQLFYLENIPQSAVCNEAVKITTKRVNKGAAGFVNGLLRSVIREKDRISYPENETKKLGITESYPKWLLTLWTEDYGFEKAKEIAIHSNKPKGASYRINYLKAPSNFVLPPDLESPQNEKAFRDGFITVQDKGSQTAAEALEAERGQTILDLCAAPGGKTCYIAQMMQNTGEIIACDIHPHRLELIRQTANRLGAENIKCMLNDGAADRTEWHGKFDRVIADVPCSGLGVISGKPDIKWRKQDFDKLCDLQYNILKTAMRYVKKDGKLVYSTCTVHRAENEDIITKALAENKNFVLDGEMTQLFPTDEHDGFFICRLKRCE